jgi:pimeloyl-ACP methyl ester carboxylesterase
VVERARRTFLAGDPQGYAHACAALEEVDLTGVVGRITAPTLVVCGEDDAPPFTAAARELAATLPDAQLVWLSPARHAGVLEQPEQFVQALTGFLADGAAR